MRCFGQAVCAAAKYLTYLEDKKGEISFTSVPINRWPLPHVFDSAPASRALGGRPFLAGVGDALAIVGAPFCVCLQGLFYSSAPTLQEPLNMR